MKNMVVAVLLSGMFVAAPAMATGTASYDQRTALPDSGIIFATADAEASMELAVLSDREMMGTQGQVWPAWAVAVGSRAAWGALGAIVSYNATYAGTPQWSAYDMATRSFVGGLAGALGYSQASAATLGAAVSGFLIRADRWQEGM